MQTSLTERFLRRMPTMNVTQNAPLSAYTTLRVGGPAALLIAPVSTGRVVQALDIARSAGIRPLLLGNGSNMLVSDAGVDGVVIHLGKGLGRIQVKGNRLWAQAGAMLSAVAHEALAHGLTGLEFAAGIPGTVGGAACMNAGAYGGEMRDVVSSLFVYADGETRHIPASELAYGYRESLVMTRGYTVLEVDFALRAGDRDAILAKMNDLNARRRDKQPLQYPSAGSFFKRPPGHFAGALIEKAGLKGYAIGGARVSEKHAGFLINTGGATADDFYRLMRHVQAVVLDDSGVSLQPEVRLIGDFAP